MDRVADACLESFTAACRASQARGATLLHTRRAQAFAFLLCRLERFWMIPADDTVWLLASDLEWLGHNFHNDLEDWCSRLVAVPACIERLVRPLREQEDDFRPIDRTAAFVVPSVRGMIDIAGWEGSRRSLEDPAWREAAQGWIRGESAAGDTVLLEPTAGIDTAVRLHGRDRIAAVLREAREAANDRPLTWVILEAWEAQVEAVQ